MAEINKRNTHEQNKKNDFVLQAGILAASGMIVKVISLIYRSPLRSILGLEGNGYYSVAMQVYTIILLISSYSIPSAISKVIAQKLAFKEYRNAQRVFQCALIYVLVVGGIASIVTFVAAPYFVRENSVVALRVLAPTIFFSGFLGVLRGYFQAHGSMLHTSLSQILEQIFNAVVSILAAYLLMEMVSGSSDTTRAIYGSAGSALGTGAGVVSALLFMFGMYMLNRKMINRRSEHDRTGKLDSYGDIFKIILTVVTPFILSTFIYNCSTVVNMYIYDYILVEYKDVNSITTAIDYGIFSTQAVSMVNIPIAIASAMSSATIPGVAASYVRGEYETTKALVAKAIRMTMLVSIPASVGLLLLAKPIMHFIFPQQDSLDQASALLAALAVTVILYGLSTLTNAVLQGIGRVNTPVIHSVIALVVQVAGLVALLLYTNFNLYALVCANVIYSLAMCILNQISVRKHLGYKQEVVKTFVKPLIASLVMGAVAFGVYHGLYMLVPISRVALLVAIGLGAAVYFVVILLIGGVNEQELRAFPKGAMMVHIAKKLHLLH
ncbi:MAG: polysaccharide biosynthesis protein [Lachnospiraceae bacterium]|nr:polysaccharide biosynthesis protein [Lachnospiraceae bacterium]